MILMPQIDHELLEELEEDYSPSAVAEANKPTLVAAILERVDVDYSEEDLEATDRVRSRFLRDILHALAGKEKTVEDMTDGGPTPEEISDRDDRRRR